MHPPVERWGAVEVYRDRELLKQQVRNMVASTGCSSHGEACPLLPSFRGEGLQQEVFTVYNRLVITDCLIAQCSQLLCIFSVHPMLAAELSKKRNDVKILQWVQTRWVR